MFLNIVPPIMEFTPSLFPAYNNPNAVSSNSAAALGTSHEQADADWIRIRGFVKTIIGTMLCG
jgi:hypothetical protein